MTSNKMLPLGTRTHQSDGKELIRKQKEKLWDDWNGWRHFVHSLI